MINHDFLVILLLSNNAMEDYLQVVGNKFFQTFIEFFFIDSVATRNKPIVLNLSGVWDIRNQSTDYGFYLLEKSSQKKGI